MQTIATDRTRFRVAPARPGISRRDPGSFHQRRYVGGEGIWPRDSADLRRVRRRGKTWRHGAVRDFGQSDPDTKFCPATKPDGTANPSFPGCLTDGTGPLVQIPGT